jgi:hypothetical protein
MINDHDIFLNKEMAVIWFISSVYSDLSVGLFSLEKEYKK